jgi:hypothetical protein
MAAERELTQRLTRLEQEVEAIKQRLNALLTLSAPTSALDLLAQLWQTTSAPQTTLTLAEARELLTKGLPTRWGSQQVKRQRTQR